MKKQNMRHIFFVLWICIPVLESGIMVQAQDNKVLTLQYCQTEACNNYPAIKDKNLLQNASALKVQNVRAGLLPQFSLNGQVTYQSDAIDISFPTPNGTPVSIGQSKDQYKATLDINQLLFDGGTTRYQRNVEEATLSSDLKQVDVDVFKIKEQVNNVYFLLLSLQENYRLLNATLIEISEKEKIVGSSVKNGVLMSSDLDVIIAERLKVEQQLAEIEINKRSALSVLGLFIDKNLSDSTKFELPIIEYKDTGAIKRPELALFDLQGKRIDAGKKLTGSLLMPKAYAFAQAGYGRPGLNMLNNEFSSFYIVGATLKWNLWDWNKNKRDRQVLEFQKQMVNTRRETFDKNLNIDLQNRLATIHKLEEALQRDNQIVELRGKIARTSASRLENGVITSTDYLTDLNAETIAKINLETHKIQLEQAKANYLVAQGNF
jgi:outer membrane protein TolC